MRIADLQRRGFSVGEMRKLAKATLPKAVFDFADGAAEGEKTLRWNEAAFDAIQLLPRPLNGAATRDLSIELFGQRLSLPVLVGPTGLSGLFWPGGEQCTARAASAAGTVFIHRGEAPQAASSSRLQQVFIYTDRGFTRELAERAKAAGYDALVLTTDNQLLGNRERDLRNGFTIPPRFGASAVAEMAMKSGWLWRMRKDLRTITFGNYRRAGESAELTTLSGRMASLLDPSMSWRDVEALRRIWTGPLILKGILHPEEARNAVERGIDGIIVSNHGGRQLDGVPASIDALPAVVQAVEGRIPVLVDGGVRRGTDVVKALALGARACLIGRPQLWGLSVAGEAGVAHVLEIYRREIDRAMGLCGISRVGDIDATVLRRA